MMVRCDHTRRDFVNAWGRGSPGDFHAGNANRVLADADRPGALSLSFRGDAS
jgi:hypothetical protein